MPSRTDAAPARRPAGERPLLWAALTALACLLGAVPLAAGNPAATSDSFFHLLRAAELARQLRAGVPYPRWAPDFYLGYGYPIFLFTPLLPYYLVLAFHALGLPLLSAMAALEAAALEASGLLAFAWLRRHAPAPAAAAGAVLYALAPYHLVNLYYRGDLAEFLAAACFPAILLALEHVLARPSARRALLLAVAVATLLLTHFLSALLFLPVVLVIALTNLAWTKRSLLARQLAAGAGGALLGAGLSAFAWLPAVADSNLATFAKLRRFYSVDANFPAAPELFSRQFFQHYSPVFSGASGYGYQFGLLQALALLAGLVALPFLWRRRRAGRAVVFLLVAGAALAGCLRVSAPVWHHLPALQLAQFPWRLLAIAALPAAYLAGQTLSIVGARWRTAAAALACAAVAVSSLVLLQPLRVLAPPDLGTPSGIARFELLYHLAGTSAAAEYLPPWATQRQTISAEAEALATGYAPPADPAASVASWQPSSQGYQASFDLKQPGAVTLPVLQFPGWTATVDGRPAPLRAAPGSGLATLDLPASRHTVALHFSDPPFVRAGDVVSVIAAILAALAVVRPSRKGRSRFAPSQTTKPAAAGWAWWSGSRGGAGENIASDGMLPSGGPENRGQPFDVVGAAPRGRPARVVTNGRELPPNQGGPGGPPLRRSLAPRGIAATVCSAALVAAPCLVAIGLGAVGSRAAATGWQNVDAVFDDGLTIQGYAFSGPVDAASGAARVSDGTLRLRLQASGPGKVALQLSDGAGADWADWRVPATGTADDLALPLPAALPPGLYTLRAGAAAPGRPADYQPSQAALVPLLPVDGDFALGPIIVWQGDASAATAAKPVGVWSGRATLSAPSLPAQAAAGSALTARWTWQTGPQAAQGRLSTALQLVDAAGHVLGSSDAEPAAGLFPSAFWRPGVTIADHARLLIPADTPPGLYHLTLALLTNGQPLPAQDGGSKAIGDAIDLGPVTVTPPTAPAAWQGGGASLGPLAVALAEPLPPAVPGQPWHVALRWHWDGKSAPPATADFRLERAGQVLAQQRITIGGSTYPAPRWRPGETERQDVDLALGGAIAAGPAQLVVQLDGAAPASATLAAVNVAGRPHVFSAQPRAPLAVPFANGVTLVGYDVHADGAPAAGAVRARQSLDVTLYWRAAGPTASPLKMSLQLLAADGHLLAQADTEPEGGAAPTTSWLAREIVTSRHQLSLAGLPASTDRLVAILYDPATGKRVATNSGDVAAVATVTVAP